MNIFKVIINKIHRFRMRRAIRKYSTLRADIPVGSIITIISGDNDGISRRVVKSEGGIVTVDIPFPCKVKASDTFENG